MLLKTCLHVSFEVLFTENFIYEGAVTKQSWLRNLIGIIYNSFIVELWH